MKEASPGPGTVKQAVNGRKIQVNRKSRKFNPMKSYDSNENVAIHYETGTIQAASEVVYKSSTCKRDTLLP